MTKNLKSPRALGARLAAGHRWGVFSRVMAGALGGYAVTALATAALSLLLPRWPGLSRADAVLAATLSSFIWYTIIVMWVFHARSALRAWVGLAGAGMALFLLLLAGQP